jgi:capsular polysaccharide biosynthesis protein
VEPKNYVLALLRRWVWIGTAATAAAAIGVLIAMASVVTYRSSTALYVGIDEAAGAQDAAAGSLVDRRVLPSLVELATTARVLGPVVDGLDLDVTPTQLADSVAVSVVEDTTVLQIAVDGPDPGRVTDIADEVAAQLRAATEAIYADPAGEPLLRVSTLEPASTPRFQIFPSKRNNAVIGFAAGAVVAALLVGLQELWRPRVRDYRDAERVTTAPVVEVAGTEIGATRPHESERGRALERLWWMLHEASPSGRGGRFAIIGPRAEELARDMVASAKPQQRPRLSAAGSRSTATVIPVWADEVEVRPLGDPTELTARSAEFDGVLVSAHAGRTSRGRLAGVLTAAERAGVPVVGVVVEDVLPRRAGLRTRVLAAIRGDSPLGPLDSLARTWGPQPTAHRVTSTRVVAVAAVAALGLAQPLAMNTTTGLLAVTALLPVWAGAVRGFRGARFLLAMFGAALVAGWLLAAWSSMSHEIVLRNAVAMTLLLVTGAGSVGLLLWARTVLPLPAVALAYGLGALATGILRSPSSENALKFELLQPITFVLLALLAGKRHPVLSLVALSGLGAVNILNDARSAFGFCLVAAALVLWQSRPADPEARVGGTRWGGVLALGALVVGMYYLVTELLTAGVLGADVGARTTAQIQQTGSLLLGARPEWTATLALMSESPLGFGLGVVPSPADVVAAKTGFAVTNIPSGQNYLERYLLDERFELHSVLADLWAAAGPVGLALGVAMGALAVRALSVLVARREAGALQCFLAVVSVWFLAFGTVTSNLPELAFALGLLLVPVARRRPAARRDDVAARPG